MKTVTLDFETNGIDTQNDRILTCFMRAKDGNKVVFEQNWIIDPGVEVPDGAAEVHGMTTEWIREHGRKDVMEAVFEIAEAIETYAKEGFVVCGYNHSFDLAMLDSETRRLGTGPTMVLSFPAGTRFLDPCIFSRVFDKYKKGGHKLITVAERNGIKVEEDRLHAADYDVEVTEKLVPIMLNRAWKELAKERKGKTPDEFVTYLQSWQKNEKAKWAKSTTEYFAKQGQKEEDGSPIVLDGRFPW